MGAKLSRVDILKEQMNSWDGGYMPSDEVCERWVRYADLAKEWGRKMDLTAPGTIREQHELLFLDAFTILSSGMSPEGGSIVDVGAGVGAPTIPLLMAKEQPRAVLVEPRRKRVAFMRYVIGAQKLHTRAVVLEERVSIDTPQVAEMPFDLALSRATFAPHVWIDVGASLAKEVIVMIGRADVPEHARLKRSQRVDYEVPSTGSPRSLLLYR